MDRCHTRTKELLLQNRAQLNVIAKALLERETLDATEIKQLLATVPNKPAKAS